jgi:hypothetical protein
MSRPKLTQKRLKELLYYDPDTGLFYWKVTRGGRLAGTIAGYYPHNWYPKIRVDNILYDSHRLAFLYMEGYFPEYEVDHKNRIRDDNRWENLRHVSQSCNVKNRSLFKSSKSGVTGVCWHKRNHKWRSYINAEDEIKYLGSFSTLKEAAQARWEAEVKYDYPNCNTTSSAYCYLQKEKMND